jgi:hypothetical protein
MDEIRKNIDLSKKELAKNNIKIIKKYDLISKYFNYSNIKTLSFLLFLLFSFSYF